MAITVAQLQTLLSGTAQGGTFSLSDTALGIAAVQTLFDSYLPAQTLTLDGATIDSTALTVTGTTTIGGYANVSALAQFLTDATQTNVTGIVISAQTGTWDITTTFLTFTGDYLGTLGFTTPTLVLSAIPDPTTAIAVAGTGIGATLPFTAPSGTVNLPFISVLTSDATDNYVLEASFPFIALGTVADLSSGLPSTLTSGVDFDILPGAVPVDSTKLGLTALQLTVSPGMQAVVSLTPTLYLADTWTLVSSDPTFLPISDLEGSFLVAFPGSSGAPTAEIAATLTLPGGAELLVGFSLPDLSMFATLETPIDLAPILDAWLPSALPTSASPQITQLNAVVSFTPSFVFNLQMLLADPFQITSSVVFENVYLMLEGGDSSSLGGSLFATFDIDGWPLQVGASYDSSSGWTFSGMITATPSQPVTVGQWIAEMASSFGWTTPAPLAQLGLTSVQLSAASQTGSFTFEVAGTFPLANAQAAFTVTADLTSSSGTYSGDATGELVLTPASGGTLTFDVTFSETATDTKFTAAFSDQGGTISLTDLATALGFPDPGIPSGLDLSLQQISFSYDTANSALSLSASSPTWGSASFQSSGSGATSSYSFNLQIDETLDLSNLPLIGKALSSLESVTIGDFVVQVSSASATATAVVTLGMTMTVGGDAIPASVTLGGTPTNGGGTTLARAAAQATTGTGDPTVSDGATWYTLQQSFGPVTIEKIGIKYADSVVWFLISASLELGGFTMAVQGLAMGSPLSSFSPEFDIEGLTLAYAAPPVTIGGSFLNVQPPQSPATLQFDGGVTFGTPELTIVGYGSYATISDQPSLFLFAEVLGAFGGPPAFFITGFAGGFGYNSQLQLPTLAQVPTFPLLAALPGSTAYSSTMFGGASPAPLTVLQTLNTGTPQWITPSIGEYWGAVGLTFTSYDIVKSQAVAILELGNDFAISVIGASRAVFALDGQTYANVELDLELLFEPDQGVFSLEAVLSPSSFLIDPACVLTGGFAFFVWWDPSPYAGDFVLTLGGYNPGFDPPSYYPTVPRVGFHWMVDSTVNASGGAYMALTPAMLMAGGSLDITFQSGNLKAWLSLYADFLIQWTPFFFEASFGVAVGASYRLNLGFCTKTITASLSADLALWGPSTGGSADVSWFIISFTVDFGSTQAQDTPAVQWSDVETQLPTDSSGNGPNVVTLAPVAGLMPPQTSPAGSGGGDDAVAADDTGPTTPWVARGASLAFTTSTVVPASQLTAGATVINGSTLNVAPMGLTGLTSAHTLTIVDFNQQDVTPSFTFTAITSAVPASLWGTPAPGSGLQVPTGTSQTVQGQLVGLSVQVLPPSLGNSAGAMTASSALMRDDLELADAVLPLDASAGPTGDVAVESATTLTTLTDPDAGIASTSITAARAAIFSALSTLGYAPAANDPLTTFSAQANTALRAEPLLVTVS